MDILDRYLDDLNVEIIFKGDFTRKQIEELLYFKDLKIPDYFKLFLEQSNGLIIESEYSLDELGEPAHMLINACDDLSYTKKKVNGLPDKRFVKFAGNEDDTDYLFDMDRPDPNGNPLILISIPTRDFCIPLTNSFNVFLECVCLGVCHSLEKFAAAEGKIAPTISKKMLRKKKRILPCLKGLFQVAKREYELLDIWHVPPKTKQMIQKSMVDWFKELKRLVAVFK